VSIYKYERLPLPKPGEPAKARGSVILKSRVAFGGTVGVVLAMVADEGHVEYVTWVVNLGRSPMLYFSGHYFAEDLRAALDDFEERR